VSAWKGTSIETFHYKTVSLKNVKYKVKHKGIHLLREDTIFETVGAIRGFTTL